MKKFLLSFTLFILSAVTFAATPSQQLQSLLNSISSMQGNFTQQVYNSHNRVIRSMSGTMALQKPGLFRWNITSPRPVSMVSNGKLIWVYDQALKQVTISNAKKAEANSPAAVLSNRIQLLSNYFIVFQKDGWFILNTRYKNDMLKQVQLKFSGQRLVQMRMFDNLGQHSQLTFSNVVVNRSLSRGQFTFQVPAGVDVVKNISKK